MAKWSDRTPTPVTTPIVIEKDEPEFYVTVTLKTKCKVPASSMDSGDAEDKDFLDYSEITAGEFMDMMVASAERDFGSGANGMFSMLMEYGFLELEFGRTFIEQEFDVEVSEVD
jgi:hypothetical protein